jgi:DUF3052 family protein
MTRERDQKLGRSRDFTSGGVWHLRRGLTQCGLCGQAVPTRQLPWLGYGRGGRQPGGHKRRRRREKGFEEELVSATARQAHDQQGLAERLGIKPGQVVQEIGYDDDCDQQLRSAISQQKDTELVDEDYDDVVDVVLLWWRDGDGDLFDALADALTPLADGGYIWLLTPKAGRDNHVEPSEIGEAALTAGLSQTSSVSAGRDWLGTRLVAPRARR